MRALTGKALATGAELDAAAMELIERGWCEAVVVSLGAEGALLASGDGCERFASPDVKVQAGLARAIRWSPASFWRWPEVRVCATRSVSEWPRARVQERSFVVEWMPSVCFANLDR
jgi:hypothetical protein